MTSQELAARLSSLDWSHTSLQHQLAVAAAVETLSEGKRAPVVNYPYQVGDPRFDGADAFECYQTQPARLGGETKLAPLPIGHNVVALVPPSAKRTMRTVRLVHLDGRPFAEAGFLPGLASAPWSWIAETVSSELGCAEEAVGCAEADDAGGDFVTVDGIPCYRVAL